MNEKKPRMTAKRLEALLSGAYQDGFDAGQLQARWWEFIGGGLLGGFAGAALMWWLV